MRRETTSRIETSFPNDALKLGFADSPSSLFYPIRFIFSFLPSRSFYASETTSGKVNGDPSFFP